MKRGDGGRPPLLVTLGQPVSFEARLRDKEQTTHAFNTPQEFFLQRLFDMNLDDYISIICR